MRHRIAIIDTNSLSNMALQAILVDMIPQVEVNIYSSVQQIIDIHQENFAHFFAGANVVFNSMDFFTPVKHKTIVLCEGDGNQMQGYGFRTLNVSLPESSLLKELLALHQIGHPNGHSNLEQKPQSLEPPKLSAREQEVLKYAVLGYLNKEIAEKLHITMATVAFHRNNISIKLGSRSLGHLTIYAVMHGIVKIGEL